MDIQGGCSPKFVALAAEAEPMDALWMPITQATNQ
jgi:hypothetical protein